MKNIYFALLCFYLLIPQISLGQKNLNKGKATDKDYYTEVAFEFVNGKIIIPVTIENKTYRFLLDTGAPNLITSTLHEQIKSRNLKVNTVRDANNRKSKMKVASIPLLTIGGVAFKNSPNLVYEHGENIIFDCFVIDGFIGSNLLRNSVVQINLEKKLLIITNDIAKINIGNAKPIKLSLVGNQKSPYLWVNLKGEKTARENLLFDTGMRSMYDLSMKNYRHLKNKNIYQLIDQGYGTNSISLFGNAKKAQHYRLLVPEFSIGEVTFKNVVTQTTDDNNSRIGTEILNYGNVTIDFENEQFYFDTKSKEIAIEEKLLGFSTTLINKRLVVGTIWDDALQSQIKIGDEILKINDVDYQKTHFCEFVTNASALKKEDHLNITFRTQTGEIKEITLDKKLANSQDSVKP